jgi:hypothetical protein
MRQRRYLTKNPKKIDEIIMLVVNTSFNDEVNRLRRDFTGWHSFPPLIKGQPIAERMLRRSQIELDRAIIDLLGKIDLPTTWLDLIRQYILTNDFAPAHDYDPDGVVLEIESDGKTKPKEAHLVLHKNLTKEAVTEAWTKIRKKLDMPTKRKRKKVPKQFRRDYEIYKLHTAGKSWIEISEIIKKKYGDDFLEGVLKNANSRMKKRLNR